MLGNEPDKEPSWNETDGQGSNWESTDDNDGLIRLETIELDPIYWGFTSVILELTQQNGVFTLR